MPFRYTYKQAPVRSGAKEIRLLYIESAKDRAEPLRCRLEVASLADPTKYSTLSYCWGKQRDRVRLHFDGGYLSISESVDNALRSVRALRVRRIWVDQICINQEDVLERNDQIILMKDIYSSSRECFVYLGEGTGKDHVKELEQLKQFVKAYRGQLGLLGLIGSLKIANGTFSPVKKGEKEGTVVYQETPWQRCMRNIISQPYFSRIWVIQELRFSPVVTCLWGRCTLDWDVVQACAKEIPIREGLSANTAFQQMPSQLGWIHHEKNTNFLGLDTQTSKHTKGLAAALYRFTRFVGLLDTFIERPCQPLFSILIASRSLHATDDRDKVFALLGLAHDQDDFPRPDYTWSREKVFRTFAEIFLLKERSVPVLCSSGLQISDRNSYSWTPWWSDANDTWDYQTHSPFRTGGPLITQQQPVIESNGIIISGHRFETVAYVCPVRNIRDGLSSKVGAMVRDASPIVAILKPHRTPEEIEASLIQLIFLDLADTAPEEIATLTGLQNLKLSHALDFISGRFSDRLDIRTVLKRPHVIKFILANGLGRLIDEPSYKRELDALNGKVYDEVALGFKVRNVLGKMLEGKSVEYLRFLQNIDENSRIIITETGRLGIAPSETRTGDAIVVVQGARAPFIFRETRHGRFQNVGQAYVRGIMFGEALGKIGFSFEAIKVV